MLLFGSELLLFIGATPIEAFGDSLLVVYQIFMDFVCFDESFNIYLDKCLDIISISDCFSIAHIFRHDIEEKMRWHNKHPTIMLIMVYCSKVLRVEIFNMQVKARIGGSLIFIVYKIL